MQVSKLFCALVFAFLTGTYNIALAQNAQCALRIDQSPEVRGLRLGMTRQQVSARYPAFTIQPANEFGETNVNVYPLAEGNKTPALKGIGNMKIRLIDDLVVELRIDYNALPWENMDQFISKLSERLSLPKQWIGEGYLRKLSCQGFQIEAMASSYSTNSMTPSIIFSRIGADNVVEKRKAEKRARERETFEP